MKTNSTKIGFLTALSAMAFSMVAQVTITRADFPRPNNLIDTLLFADVEGVEIPSTGPDQVWDYSQVTATSYRVTNYTDATAEPNFPKALTSCDCDMSFSGLPLTGTEFDAIDSIGYYEYGRRIDQNGFSIAGLTGGPNDSLIFPANDDIYSGRIDILKFPVNYLDNYTESHVEVIKYKISVGAYALHNVPGELHSTETRTREVVGYGTLKIPQASITMPSGLPSQAMDVLLIKSTKTVTDTFTLGGGLAPEALLSAFGVSQAQSRTSVSYIFYRPGFPLHLFSIETIDGQVTKVEFHPEGADNAPLPFGPQALVSNNGFKLSTTVTTATANSYPWPGALSVPDDSTFTEPVVVGQPYPWEHLYAVEGTEVISSLSGVTYYRSTFSLASGLGIKARIRMFVDDDMEVFINGVSVALEDGIGPMNWRTVNHDLLFDGPIGAINGNAGGDPFDVVTTADMDTVFKTGLNEVVLAIRNRTSKPDVGGFSFRMDLEQIGGSFPFPIDPDGGFKSAPAKGETPNALISVYPNPANSIITVQLDKAVDAKVMLHDLGGKVLVQKTMSQETQLDLSPYTTGIYLLRVISGDKVYTEKIMKQ